MHAAKPHTWNMKFEMHLRVPVALLVSFRLNPCIVKSPQSLRGCSHARTFSHTGLPCMNCLWESPIQNQTIMMRREYAGPKRDSRSACCTH